MQRMIFSLNISAEQYLRYYQGTAKSVQVISEDGRSLRFPASELQRFVDHNGIQGRFEIVFNDDFKLQKIRQIT